MIIKVQGFFNNNHDKKNITTKEISPTFSNWTVVQQQSIRPSCCKLKLNVTLVEGTQLIQPEITVILNVSGGGLTLRTIIPGRAFTPVAPSGTDRHANTTVKTGL